MKKLVIFIACAALFVGVTMVYAKDNNISKQKTTDNPMLDSIPDDATAESFEHILDYEVEDDISAPIVDLNLSIEAETIELAEEYNLETDSKNFKKNLIKKMKNDTNKEKKSKHRGFLLEKKLVKNNDLKGKSYSSTLQDKKKLWRVVSRYPNGYNHPKVGLIKDAIVTSYYDANTGENIGTEIANVNSDVED